jgi:hypothetical protein
MQIAIKCVCPHRPCPQNAAKFFDRFLEGGGGGQRGTAIGAKYIQCCAVCLFFKLPRRSVCRVFMCVCLANGATRDGTGEREEGATTLAQINNHNKGAGG